MQMYAAETQENSRFHTRWTSVVSVKPKSYHTSAEKGGSVGVSVLRGKNNSPEDAMIQ